MTIEKRMETQNVQDKQHQIRRTTVFALVTNIGLSGMKIIGGWFGNSSAVLADGFHSLSDCVTDIAVIIGVGFWSKPPDKAHPYGHWKIETITAIGIGAALLLTAIGVAWESMSTIGLPAHSLPSSLALSAAVMSIVIKEALYRYTLHKSRKFKSTALKANAWHQRSDVFSSIPVALSVIIVWIYPQLYWIEAIAAIIVSVCIGYAAVNIVRSNFSQLVDGSASRLEENLIFRAANGVEGVDSIQKMRTRTSGNQIYVDMIIVVAGEISVRAAHQIANMTETAVKDQVAQVLEVFVHIEPNSNSLLAVTKPTPYG